VIFVLTGKSSSGKDTLLKELVNQNLFKECISTTSRPIRINEKNNIDYMFINKDEFLEKIKNNDFIEYRTYETELKSKKDIWYYGTEKKAIDILVDTVLVLDLQGLKDVRDYFSSSEISEEVIGIYLHCPSTLRTERAKKRGSFCEIEWNRRLLADKKDFADVYSEVQYVLNGAKGTEELAQEIKQIKETL
jgi:guanylate kinase